MESSNSRLTRPAVADRALHSFKIPSLVKRSFTWAAFLRSAAAILSAPVARRNPMAAFRNAAITSGPTPLRIWLASSPNVVSRT